MMIKRRALLASAALLSLASASSLFAALTDTDILAQADNYFRYIKLTKTQIEDVFINGKTVSGASVDEAKDYMQNGAADALTAAQAVATLIDGSTDVSKDDAGKDLESKVSEVNTRFGYDGAHTLSQVKKTIDALDASVSKERGTIKEAIGNILTDALGSNDTASGDIDDDNKSKVITSTRVRGVVKNIKDLIDPRKDGPGSETYIAPTLLQSVYRMHELLSGQKDFTGNQDFASIEDDIAFIMGRNPDETTDKGVGAWGGGIGDGIIKAEIVKDASDTETYPDAVNPTHPSLLGKLEVILGILDSIFMAAARLNTITNITYDEPDPKNLTTMINGLKISGDSQV